MDRQCGRVYRGGVGAGCRGCRGFGLRFRSGGLSFRGDGDDFFGRLWRRGSVGGRGGDNDWRVRISRGFHHLRLEKGAGVLLIENAGVCIARQNRQQEAQMRQCGASSMHSDQRKYHAL